MFSNDRTEIRQFYVNLWKKHTEKKTLEPIEKQLIEIIEHHPEYHKILSDESLIDKDFGADNPILHISLHQAIREQLSIDTPKGIKTIYESLMTKIQDHHAVEHIMMECLAQSMWDLQNNPETGQDNYLNRLKELCK